ncbi:hypothetical protein NGM10_06645 [Halorussus salilacus]|uniref:hypothetical protein n=1 Tax=Halorussus salilacus TaxID=2953750 RepID=UPI0020A1BA20|nr:hypothetical protein [Halorussus salilacus]USZ69408.1 hypothetical protein NGM10_06645 [Halorussus salilacus]
MSERLSKAQREKVQELIDERVEDIRRAALKLKIEQLTGEVLGELHNRGVDTDPEGIDMVEIARECVLDVMFGDETSAETIEIPVGGRHNHGHTTEVTLETEDAPETYLEEVPIEDGEDPETVEVERVEPSGDPRLNGELSSSEITRAFQEGLTPEMILGDRHTNDEDTSEEPNPEDVPRAGLPWYQ